MIAVLSSNVVAKGRRPFALVILVFSLVVLFGLVPVLSAATSVIKPSNMQGWAFVQESATGSGSMVSGPGSPPAGTGSANLIVTNATGGEIIGKFGYAGTPLANLTTLTYWTYRTSGTAALAPSLQLVVDYDLTDGNTSYQGRLVFEPYLTGTSPSTGVWESWNPLTGDGWFATGAPGNSLCTMGSPCTLADVLGSYSNVGIHATPAFGAVLFKAGSGWTGGFNGNVDNFTIGISGTDDTYDFEPETPCTTTCYVNDATGNDSYGGDTPTTAKKTIQAGVNAVSSSGTVIVATGVYTENVTLNKSLTLEGAGQTNTIIRPALSGPNCTSGGGSICPGGSNVILVEASNVIIHDLKIEGDNPALTSGVIRSGADVDARNGIITNHTLSTPYTNVEVYNLTIEDIYLRAIYFSTLNGSFHAHDNTISNVTGEAASIAIFNFYGTGIIEDNNVDDANDAIASNWSQGAQYLNNTVTNSGSGVHSDNNGGAGGTGNLLKGNTVSNCKVNGYGVWVFAPYVVNTVEENTVNNCAVGLAAAGRQGASAVTTNFIENTVDSMSLAGSTGVYVTTSLFGFGSTNVDATFSNNVIQNSTDLIFLESEPTYTLAVTATNNSFAGYSNGISTGGGGGAFSPNFSANWWGSNVAATVKTAANNGVLVDYTPWLDTGTDTSGNPGFQGDFLALWADDDSPQIGSTLRLQEGVNLLLATGLLRAVTGTYEEQVEMTQAMTLRGDGVGATTVLAPTTMTKFFATAGPNNNYPILYVHDTAGVTIEDVTVDGDGRGNTNFRFIGIGYRNAGGTVDDAQIIDIRDNPISGGQHGVAVYAFADNGTNRSLNVTDSSLSGFQKNGTVFTGANLTVNFSGNTVIGAGAINFTAQNGVQLSGGAAGTISNNVISGFAFTPFTFSSAGVLVTGAAGPVATTGNHVSESMVDIWYINVGGNIASNTITNTVAGMGATPYWWGIVADPGAGTQPQPPASPVDGDINQANGGEAIDAIATTVQLNTLTGGGNGAAIEADSLGTETMTLLATRNTVNNWDTAVVLYKDAGASLAGTVTGNNISTVVTVFDLFPGTTMLAYANNISSFTDAGLTTAAGTFNARHNWWGTYAAQPAGVDNDSWNYLLGADMVTFADGTGTVSLADATAGGNASLTGAGTLVIVNHSTGQANVPFGKGIPGDTNASCADFYDMFAVGGSGSYDVSIPIKTGALTQCDDNALVLARIFEFDIDGGDGSPNSACSPDSTCWDAVAATYSSGVLTASGLAAINFEGTPFAAPSEFNQPPTAIKLTDAGLRPGSGSSLWLLLALFGLVLLVSTAVAWRRRPAR